MVVGSMMSFVARYIAKASKDFSSPV